MSKPNGKLAFAYQSIARLEEDNKQLKSDRERYANNSGEWEASALHWMAEYDRMKAENESLRKDAERYRWIRDVMSIDHLHDTIIAADSAEEYDFFIDQDMARD